MKFKGKSSGPRKVEKPNPVDYRGTAEAILGLIEWEDPTKGYCKCPGLHLHTNNTGDKDTEVRLADGRPPTVYCFHESCKAKVEEANSLLRSDLGKQEWKVEQYEERVGQKVINKPVPTPEQISDDTERFLSYIFNEDDIISVQFTYLKDGRDLPAGGGINVRTAKQWIEGIQSKEPYLHPANFAGEDAYAYMIRVNPVKMGSKGGNSDVTDWKYTLIESDEMPKDEQERILRASGLPIAAMIDSGGKSIHAWVRVDASSERQYHKRREKIWAALPDEYVIDTQNKNPSRFSRLPGAMRGDKEQKLLGLGIGATDYLAWERSVEDADENVPVGPVALDKFDFKNDPKCLIGKRWLCQGAVFGFVGPTGVGKSTLLMQMIMQWGLGRDFYGILPKRPLKSYVVQYENDDGDLAEQFQGIRKGMGLQNHEVEILNERLIFHNVMKHVGLDMKDFLYRTIERETPDILWIDPLLSYIGGDISDQEYMTEWLARMIVPIARDTGCVIGLVQHTGKPKDPKTINRMTATDMAYQALGSSIIPNACREMINLTQIKMPDGEPMTFRLDLCKRRNKAGMRDNDGILSNHIHIRHSTDKIYWERCAKPDPERKQSNAQQ